MTGAVMFGSGSEHAQEGPDTASWHGQAGPAEAPGRELARAKTHVRGGSCGLDAVDLR
jgi:hypothetical protein